MAYPVQVSAHKRSTPYGEQPVCDHLDYLFFFAAVIVESCVLLLAGALFGSDRTQLSILGGAGVLHPVFLAVHCTNTAAT